MAKVRADNFAAEVQKILNKYEGDVQNSLADITKGVAQKTAKQLQAVSRSVFAGSGRYAKGWKVTTDNGRLIKIAVVHNADMPGLPHLLEHGHVSIVHGKRVGIVKGRPHIAPVEQEAIDLYKREVLAKL